MTAIALSRLHFPVTTLGPGRRIGIWTQGCSLRCPGCLSPETWRFRREKTPVADVIAHLRPWLAQADGITVSGGEPFDQPQALAALLTAIRAEFHGDILVFSGYPFPVLNDELARMTGLIDALMSEPFEQDAPQTLRLRGSDNQRLHLLTPLGETCFARYNAPLPADEKVLDLAIDDAGVVSLIGIPRRDDMQRLNEFLTDRGHSFTPVLRDNKDRNRSL
ncbi:4Fe-4S single cluster domain-containing protein [Enterobacillus tribolii]|uniref:Anaerobic ribonucleoside-triphosphate reductase activating protein n=1 Tax=Enterobacillus tribolii TaxID=1487935 RepID=A0A370R4M8_9GAMM|nr:4Fe-4S single cluster domain-containing protein [Enterobacillus tribolii]MBW7983327.1 radical SAM protein [Enterobacillus tribolii]RDK97384.1 anaerobic ribonucleoside-triphosphate reductase activating protein [Enterobacillus tribolii]